MKTVTFFAGVTALSSTVSAHAIWQQLWVNGKDLSSTCVRMPPSNNPVTDVTSNDIVCNASPAAASSKCTLKAGDTVTIEMHQHNSRGCTEEAIGGAHYGPVLAYLSKVSDSSTATGNTPWFKVYEDTWGKASSSSQGADDYWGTKDLNTNCGLMDFTIPADLAGGDYLLRAEAIALHAASSEGGAQFYMSCYQLSVEGSGSSSPAGVSFPGAYKASDPGIKINIYQALSTYVAPGPAVASGGTEAVAGKAPGGKGAGGGSGGGSGSTTTAAAVTGTKTQIATTTAAGTTLTTSKTSAAAPTTTAGSGGGGCTAAKFAQCGGSGFSGCATCASGSSCVKQNDYYSQCM